MIAAIAVASVVTFQTTPKYSSTARLFVSTSLHDTDQAYQGSLFSAQRVTSYADLVSGREVSSRVIDRLGVDMTPTALSEKVSASVVPETVILEVGVTDPNPQM